MVARSRASRASASPAAPPMRWAALAHRARVQRVDRPGAAGHSEHLPAEGGDEVGVVGLEVAEHERPDAPGGTARSASAR